MWYIEALCSKLKDYGNGVDHDPGSNGFSGERETHRVSEYYPLAVQ